MSEPTQSGCLAAVYNWFHPNIQPRRSLQSVEPGRSLSLGHDSLSCLSDHEQKRPERHHKQSGRYQRLSTTDRDFRIRSVSSPLPSLYSSAYPSASKSNSKEAQRSGAYLQRQGGVKRVSQLPSNSNRGVGVSPATNLEGFRFLYGRVFPSPKTGAKDKGL